MFDVACLNFLNLRKVQALCHQILWYVLSWYLISLACIWFLRFLDFTAHGIGLITLLLPLYPSFSLFPTFIFPWQQGFKGLICAFDTWRVWGFYTTFLDLYFTYDCCPYICMKFHIQIDSICSSCLLVFSAEFFWVMHGCLCAFTFKI